MGSSSNGEVILLIDDDKDILEFVSYTMQREGFKVFSADNAMEGIRLAKEIRPALILLDVMMPQMDGIEACHVLRDEPSLKTTIIAFLTSRAEDYSQIAGYKAGADDYIGKPIRPRLLVSKVESLLRRRILVENVAVEQTFQIDRDRFQVKVKGNTLDLPKKEFELLELLTSKPGKVFTRDQILILVWGEHAIVGVRTIDVHIRKLREKLGNDYIRTIKGVGYTFNEF